MGETELVVKYNSDNYQWYDVHFTVFFAIDPVCLLMIQITTVINTLTAITTITTLITLTVTITVTGESVDARLEED